MLGMCVFCDVKDCHMLPKCDNLHANFFVRKLFPCSNVRSLYKFNQLGIVRLNKRLSRKIDG